MPKWGIYFRSLAYSRGDYWQAAEDYRLQPCSRVDCRHSAGGEDSCNLATSPALAHTSCRSISSGFSSSTATLCVLLAVPCPVSRSAAHSCCPLSVSTARRLRCILAPPNRVIFAHKQCHRLGLAPAITTISAHARDGLLEMSREPVRLDSLRPNSVCMLIRGSAASCVCASPGGCTRLVSRPCLAASQWSVKHWPQNRSTHLFSVVACRRRCWQLPPRKRDAPAVREEVAVLASPPPSPRTLRPSRWQLCRAAPCVSKQSLGSFSPATRPCSRDRDIWRRGKIDAHPNAGTQVLVSHRWPVALEQQCQLSNHGCTCQEPTNCATK